MTVMLTGTIGPFAQRTFHRPAAAAAPSPKMSLLVGCGLLAARRFEPASVLERLGAVESFQALPVLDVSFMRDLYPILTEELEFLAQPATELLALEIRQPPSTLAKKRTVVSSRRESPKPEPDVQPFVIAIRGLIESEQLPAARQMLNAAPAYILSDPLVVKLRSVLAPPIVKPVDKRDVDRNEEYEWLRTEGHKYRGCWVALDGNNLLAVARTLRELQETLKARDLTRPPLLHRVD